MPRNFDLFGDPIPDNWGMRGRPEHIATEENAFKIKVLLADGWTLKRIAGVLDITVPTLRKHYFSVLRKHESMRDKLRAAHRSAVYKKALDGDSSAQRLMWQMMQADELQPTPQRVDDRNGNPRDEKLGKKAQAERDAHIPTGGWDDILGGKAN